MSNCLLNFFVHSHNQSPVYVCVCPYSGRCGPRCAASLSSSHHSVRLSVRGAYSSPCTCCHGCDQVFSPAHGRGVCSFSHDGSPCDGCASRGGLCPPCFAASPMGHCIAPLDACGLWPGMEATEVQGELVKCYPEPTVRCGSDPGFVGWRGR